MSAICNQVAARLASDEELGEDLRGHVEACDDCAALLAIPRGIGEISTCRSKHEPGPGFTSRVSRSAFRTLDRRRRVRVAGMATAAACACAMVVGAVTWRVSASSSASSDQQVMAASGAIGGEPAAAADTDTTAVAELVSLYDVESALSYRADWDYIQEPLEPMWLLTGEGDLP